jgi:hypothetical protein
MRLTNLSVHQRVSLFVVVMMTVFKDKIFVFGMITYNLRWSSKDKRTRTVSTPHFWRSRRHSTQLDMATLIPSLKSCKFETGGERRLAQRLEQKLDDDCLVWYDVPITGTLNQHPDFVILDPRHGILILEVKDFYLSNFYLSTIDTMNKITWDIRIKTNKDDTDGETSLKTISNPLEQARRYAHQVVRALERDPHLVTNEKLNVYWGYGVVLPNIRRDLFVRSKMNDVINPDRVICKDEMLASADPAAFQNSLRSMFPFPMSAALTQHEIDRVRWIIFPEVRVSQSRVFASHKQHEKDTYDLEYLSFMRVMDLQHEQLARSLGDGHRVIHGVAGSGKTLLLGIRAEFLAKQQMNSQGSKPILIICYNELLAKHLAIVMKAKGIDHLVKADHFHKWCRDQLLAYPQVLPPRTLDVGEMMHEMVKRVIDGVDKLKNSKRAILCHSY